MDYTITDSFEKYQATVSNLHGFLHRFLDTGFKTKWSGFWVPPYKFLDYYALKVNGTWLSEKTLEKVDYGEKLSFHHRTDSLNVKEVVSFPDDLPGFRVTLILINRKDNPKAVHTVLEPGVDIRHKSNDVPDRSYTMEKDRKKLLVQSGMKNLRIGSEHEMEFIGDAEVREHFPGDRQVCFIPSRIGFREEVGSEDSESIKIEFTTSNPRYGSVGKIGNVIDTGLFDRSFKAAENSLINLVYDRNGKGILAGHPWFQEYWGRDTFWSILGLIDAGYFELSHDILENFAEKDGFPNKILLEESDEGDFLGEDVPPLFIIAADKLKKYYGISEKIEEKMEEAMEELEIDDEITVIHEGRGTWMDTLERESSIDIQSLWLEAAKRMKNQRKVALKEGLKRFVEDEYIHDSANGKITANCAIPLMFGQLEPELVERLNQELVTEFGAATLSKKDPDYSPEGYHTGSTWGLTTGWLAAANFENNRPDKGVDLLLRMSELVDKDQLGGFPEVVNSETGENMGCVEQAWSAGMFMHVVDSYLFGITVEDGNLKAYPPEDFSGTRKHKRFGDKFYTVEVDDGEVDIKEEE